MTLTEQICSNPVLFILLKPTKLVQLSALIDSTAYVRVLDIGCGNHSARYLRAQFPHCTYTGVDHSVYNNTPEDLALMDNFVSIDLDVSGLSTIPDESFDLVVLSHVLEHLKSGRSVLREAASKLRPGGLVYVSHPHADSTNFPSRKGTLNFYDDPSHVTVFRPAEIALLLASYGCEILDTGRIRLARNLALMPLKVLLAEAFSEGIGPLLWDLYGFEEYVIARRKLLSPSKDVRSVISAASGGAAKQEC